MSEPRTLLVLDDDDTVGQIVVAGARSAGFSALLFGQALPFIDAVATRAPSHVAVDLTLPDMPGVEVLRRLALQGCRSRVLIVSGAGAAESTAALAEASRLGLAAAGVLPKPFRLAQLRQLLTAD